MFAVISLLLVSILLPVNGAFAAPDWSQNATLPPEGHRENIYNWPVGEFEQKIEKGKRHALIWPVGPTIFLPKRPLQYFLESPQDSPLRRLMQKYAVRYSGFSSLQDIYDWLGLNAYPEEDDKGIFRVPYPDGVRPDYPMGVTYRHTKNGEGLTFSCATCHSSNVFGKKILGLTNRFPRANDVFMMAKKVFPLVGPKSFQVSTKATDGERKIYAHARDALRFVGGKYPVHPSLDTSLAQVALSLMKRKDDAWATKDVWAARFPRDNIMNHLIADSKPAVWWNLKYKTRWLSDGSLVSGNPIFTNFLWNEIGRGADLFELKDWLNKSQKIVEELTTAVFATQAPHYSDFFEASRIDLAAAKRGERNFKKRCSKCHGQYQKNWSLPESEWQADGWRLKTHKVVYPKRTKVIDVGTDSGRYLGMAGLMDPLNKLSISKMMKTTIEVQKGYIPPPLVGIWVRWPYFHNNSIPNLCELLKPAAQREKSFYTGEALDAETDYDHECGGYPLGENTPPHWKKDADYFYDTTLPGKSNAGHEKMLFDNGQYAFSTQDRRDLIEFLKTL